MEIIACEKLSFSYPFLGGQPPENKHWAVSDVSFSINQGEFVLFCGESGSGKTTLLRLLKREIAPHGEIDGRILFMGEDSALLDERRSAAEIGFVMQNPSHQIVTDMVWHELSFGLENLGVDSDSIRSRVGEMASYFGIEKWFRQKTSELSGGQKQLLNLASVMVMQPKLIILDEPTAQLDPIAAVEFIATLQKINRELGISIIITEHRLEEVFSIVDRVVVMSDGGLQCVETPKNVAATLAKIDANHKMLSALPSALQIFTKTNELIKNLTADDENQESPPLTVREGRIYLSKHFKNDVKKLYVDGDPPAKDEVALKVKNAWFRYDKDGADILRGVSLSIRKGEIFSLLGGNGAGKTTMLSVITGQLKAYAGGVYLHGKNVLKYKNGDLFRNNVAYLPQNPQTVFIKQTLREDFYEVCDAMGYAKAERDQKIDEVAQTLEITHILHKHPFDISGGEQQKAALVKVLLQNPQVLLLDEPTKGIDAWSKQSLGEMLTSLKEKGITIVMVTHDVEFAARFSDRCGLFFDGEVISTASPDNFFGWNTFYTTAASRISRHMFENAVLCEDVVNLCFANRK